MKKNLQNTSAKSSETVKFIDDKQSQTVSDSTVASQLGDSGFDPQAWGLSRFSSFLPQSKHIHIRVA